MYSLFQFKIPLEFVEVEKVQRWAAEFGLEYNIYKGAVPLRQSHQGLLVESSSSKFESITCLKGCNQEGFSLDNFD